jgi:hypothetical protein
MAQRVVLALCSLLLSRWFVDDPHDVGLLHDQEILTVDLDLSARLFADVLLATAC